MKKMFTKAEAEMVEMAKIVVDAIYCGITPTENIADDLSRLYFDSDEEFEAEFQHEAHTEIIQWAERRLARLGDVSQWTAMAVMQSMIGRQGVEDNILYRTALLAVLRARPLFDARGSIEYGDFMKPSHAEVAAVWKETKKGFSHTRGHHSVLIGAYEDFFGEEYRTYRLYL